MGANALLFSIGDLEVVLEFSLGLSVAVVDVAYDDSMLEQGDAGADVDGVLQVVARYEDGGAGLLVVLREEVLDGTLAAGVEEVEGLVEDKHLRAKEHGGHDAHLLLIAGTESADELLLSCKLVCHEMLVLRKELLQLLVARIGEAGNELEVLVGGQVVDEETLVYESTCPILPSFCFGHVDVNFSVFHVNCSRVCLDKVEDETEERAFACTIVTNKSKQFTAVDGEFWYVDGNLFAECLLEVFNNNIHIN